MRRWNVIFALKYLTQLLLDGFVRIAMLKLIVAMARR
ncbi:unannotated protein [freshwater metagenome]|uniref:Unannotated protein n=1 Tax=freshwater metagenome TaxID=449393 RepID=A0A6J6EAA4_9ZZZZ